MRVPKVAPRFLVPALVSAVIAGSATLSAPAAAKKPAVDEATAATHKAFLEAIKEGSDKYAAKDVSGAIEAFHKAVDLESRNPFGYYFLGEAEVGDRDLAQAESAWLHASQVSDDGPPSL